MSGRGIFGRLEWKTCELRVSIQPKQPKDKAKFRYQHLWIVLWMSPMQQAWKRSLEILRERVDPADYESFIKRLRPVAAKERNLLVEAPNKLAVDLISDRYLTLIEEVLSQTAGAPIRVLLQPPAAVQQELFPLSEPS